MIYLIEFALLHILFYLVYRLMLSKETELRFLRGFLIGSTLLSLIVPSISIPTASMPTINTEAIILPAVNLITPTEEVVDINWPLLILGSVGTIIFLKLILTLVQLSSFYRKSNPSTIENIPVHEVKGLNNSFTFFKWIFIDTHYFENPKDIARHEYGHAKMLHSADLLFFYLLTLVFWWVPSIWLMIKELKKVHEFEADQFALSISDETYVKTLVHSTLKAHGMNLASSFDDATIFNRLNFIKKMKKKMNPFKIASITSILAISAAMFACEEQLESEIKRIADESNQQTEYSTEVEAALAKLKSENPGHEFAVIETKIENEESIKKLQKYDEDEIVQIFVTKNEDEQSVVMIVNQNSSLFEKTITIQSSSDDDVFTIVEETTSFPGGIDAWADFLSTNMKYPKQAQELGVEGRVFVEFIVETDGSISEAKVVKGIGAGCDAEALRVVQNSPNWIPGKVRGEVVRQRMIQNIAFRLPAVESEGKS